MESIANFFNSIGIDFDTFWKAALIFLLGTILLSIFGRFVFGKRSALNHAISSAIGIIFICGITVILRSAGADFSHLVAPLPYVRLSGNEMHLFSFEGIHYTVICSEVLSMIILAFLVNLVDTWFPKGKNIFIWLLFRILTVMIAYAMHLIVVWLFSSFLPDAIATYAPVVLLVILLLLLLTGALKILVGALLATVNPIIGALYTFFFATLIGKQISKAVLTTAILTGLVIGLKYAGVTVIAISTAALTAYIPVILALLLLWYLVILLF